MHPRAEEFREQARNKHGIEVDVHEFPEGTRTARDAAAALGCSVAQIAKSLVFNAGGIVVVITSGANKVDEARLADEQSVPTDAVRTADPDEVKETLGWSIGGVPPFCHETDVPVYMDRSLLNHDVVWAAAGTPNTVFPVSPEELAEASEARTVDVAGD